LAAITYLPRHWFEPGYPNSVSSATSALLLADASDRFSMRSKAMDRFWPALQSDFGWLA
jgi:hypothetical protein